MAKTRSSNYVFHYSFKSILSEFYKKLEKLCIRENKPVVEFPLIERDPLVIKERRQRIGIKEAMKVEKDEIDNSKKVSHKIPENLLGIGVRIEDDIVCTKENPINLTKEVPREVLEVEDLCSS